MSGLRFEPTLLKPGSPPAGGPQACHAPGIITGGPWILSIIGLVILSTSLRGIAANSEQLLLLSTLTHIHALMLVLTGAPALVMARFAADALSEGHPEKILPSFLGTLTVTCAVAAFGSGACFLLVVPAPPLFQWAATALSILLAASFITTGYLAALQRRGSVFFSFVCGYALSCSLAALLLHHNPGDPAFALCGFVLGHLILFLMLFSALYRELPPTPTIIDYSSFHYFLRFPDLALGGLCCSAGIWIDKLMLWWLPASRSQLNEAIFPSPQGHIAACGAILSIVPGLLVFHFKLETSLTGQFSRYFELVRGTGTLSNLRARRNEIAKNLRDGFLLLVRIQGTTTAVLLLFTEELTGFLHLGVLEIATVRVILLGAFFLALFLALLSVLFLIEDRRGILAASGVFLTTNASVSLIALHAATAYPGIGFTIASCCAFALTAARVHHLLAAPDRRSATNAADHGHHPHRAILPISDS